MASPRRCFSAAVFLCLASFPSRASAQTLHINDQWSQCAIVLDPSLSPAAWKQFVSELGIVAYLRPVASAEPLGRGNVEVGLLDWSTRIDDADPAWNDTFSHPHPDHYLMDGSALHIPGVLIRVGVADRADVGAYVTKAIGANYGFVGGQVQYNLLNDAKRQLSVSTRLSSVWLLGPEDMTASTHGLDFVVSKRVSRFSPYVGVSSYISRARETTSKVDLDPETAYGSQAMMGMVVHLSVLRLGGEFHFADKPGMSMKVAFDL